MFALKRIIIFVSVLASAIVLLVALFAWYVLVYQAGMGNLYGTMGQMMGNQYPKASMTSMPSYVSASLVALVALLIIGIGGFAYYAAYPEIVQRQVQSKDETSPQQPSLVLPTPPSPPKENWAVLMRTSKPEEKRVLEVLSAHGGNYLQKFIVKESGLSKLRTHRIVSRFAERGIVSVSKSGNTNEVSLSPWLNQPDSKKSSPESAPRA